MGPERKWRNEKKVLTLIPDNTARTEFPAGVVTTFEASSGTWRRRGRPSCSPDFRAGRGRDFSPMILTIRVFLQRSRCSTCSSSCRRLAWKTETQSQQILILFTSINRTTLYFVLCTLYFVLCTLYFVLWTKYYYFITCAKTLSITTLTLGVTVKK